MYIYVFTPKGHLCDVTFILKMALGLIKRNYKSVFKHQFAYRYLLYDPHIYTFLSVTKYFWGPLHDCPVRVWYMERMCMWGQRGRLVLYLPFLWGRWPSPLYLLWQCPPEPSEERESPLEWKGLRGNYCWCGQENKSANESERKREISQWGSLLNLLNLQLVISLSGFTAAVSIPQSVLSQNWLINSADFTSRAAVKKKMLTEYIWALNSLCRPLQCLQKKQPLLHSKCCVTPAVQPAFSGFLTHLWLLISQSLGPRHTPAACRTSQVKPHEHKRSETLQECVKTAKQTVEVIIHIRGRQHVQYLTARWQYISHLFCYQMFCILLHNHAVMSVLFHYFLFCFILVLLVKPKHDWTRNIRSRSKIWYIKNWLIHSYKKTSWYSQALIQITLKFCLHGVHNVTSNT